MLYFNKRYMYIYIYIYKNIKILLAFSTSHKLEYRVCLIKSFISIFVYLLVHFLSVYLCLQTYIEF